MQDVIEDRRSGLLVPPEDPKALRARPNPSARGRRFRALSLERERLLRREAIFVGNGVAHDHRHVLISD